MGDAQGQLDEADQQKIDLEAMPEMRVPRRPPATQSGRNQAG
jgi:hypothetical protein